MQELTTIHLVGSLGQRFGHTWHLDVKSPGEAIRAIDINTRGKLTAYLSGPARNRHYRIALQRKTNVIDKEEATHRSGRSTIYIMPTIRGRDKGLTKVFVGVAILALAWWNPYGWAYTAATATSAGGLTVAGSIAIGFGVSLVLGGITQMLTPKAQGPSTSDQSASTSFPGNATAVAQGQCVPVVYGHALVAAVPISISIANSDVTTTQVGYGQGGGINGAPAGTSLGSVNVTTLNGGGVQYTPVDPPVIFPNIP